METPTINQQRLAASQKARQERYDWAKKTDPKAVAKFEKAVAERRVRFPKA